MSSMSTEPERLDWPGPCLARAREHADPGRAAIADAMRDAEQYERFRHRVLWGALVRHLRQDPREVRRVLDAEAGRGGERPESRVSEDEGAPEPEAHSEGAQVGRWPLAELVVLAATAFDDPRLWSKAVADPPAHPVSFFSLLVTRSVQDRTRLGGSGVEAPGALFPERGRQHQVAGMLDHLAAADPERGGPVAGAAGMYRKLLARIAEHLDEREGVTTYTLRKLFPHHAWTADSARHLLGQPLLGTLEARHGASLPADLVAELAKLWETAPRPLSTGDGLDLSAAVHGPAESFPGWPEVALWSGDATPGAPFNANTLQRHVSRIDEELIPFVAAQHDRLRRLLGP